MKDIDSRPDRLINWSKVSNYEARKSNVFNNLVYSDHVQKIEDFLKKNNFEDLIKENLIFKKKISNCTSYESVDNSMFEVEFNNKLMSDLYKISLMKKKKYNNNVKEFCLFVYLLGGALLYRVLSENMNLPALSTIQKHLYSKEDINFFEASIRVTELVKFLVCHQYPKIGFLSEDMTKITRSLRHCNKSNNIVGLVAPLNSSTGLPKIEVLKFTSIKYAFNLIKTLDYADFVNAFMFQPLAQHAVPFCLMLYGANN